MIVKDLQENVIQEKKPPSDKPSVIWCGIYCNNFLWKSYGKVFYNFDNQWSHFKSTMMALSQEQHSTEQAIKPTLGAFPMMKLI